MEKSSPERSCIGCRQVQDKHSLVRFVLAPDRTLVPDLQWKLPGRGAYVCQNTNCLKEAATKRQFARAFKGEVQGARFEDIAALLEHGMRDRISGYLALANKAGKAVSGSDAVMDALRKGAVGVLFIASDSSESSFRRFASAAENHKIPFCSLFDKAHLGALLGKELRGVVAVGDGGFVTSIRSELNRYGNFFEGGVR
jgi:hypothetical protein